MLRRAFCRENVCEHNGKRTSIGPHDQDLHHNEAGFAHWCAFPTSLPQRIAATASGSLRRCCASCRIDFRNRCGKPAGQAEERRSPSLHGAMHWRRARVPDLWLRYARCLCTPPNPGGALPRDESTLCFVVPVPLPSRSASLRRRFDPLRVARLEWLGHACTNQ